MSEKNNASTTLKQTSQQSSDPLFETPAASRQESSKDTRFDVSIPAISLPRGGGSVKSMGEKFEMNAVNGSASFSIPLPFSTARGFGSAPAISYSAGAGNSIFGMGWSLG